MAPPEEDVAVVVPPPAVVVVPPPPAEVPVPAWISKDLAVTDPPRAEVAKLKIPNLRSVSHDFSVGLKWKQTCSP